MESEEKFPVTPEGSPLKLRFTVPLNPPLGATLSVYVVFVPMATVREVGVADNKKSGLCGPAHDCSAALTLSLPPVVVTPAIDGIGSTCDNSVVRSADVLR